MFDVEQISMPERDGLQRKVERKVRLCGGRKIRASASVLMWVFCRGLTCGFVAWKHVILSIVKKVSIDVPKYPRTIGAVVDLSEVNLLATNEVRLMILLILRNFTFLS